MNDKIEFTEILPVVDEAGNITGKALRGDCHFNPSKKILHPVVHLHVLNQKGEIFLQHRPLTKSVQPGKWDTAVGGHVSYGESIGKSLQREAFEEIGIKDFKAKLIQKYIWETEVERELVYMYTCETEDDIIVNQEEVSDGRFWSFAEIQLNLGNGVFTPSFEKEFLILSEQKQTLW